MKKVLVFTLALTLSSLGFAANENAAQGTKVLMDRIAALEAAVANLGEAGGGVAGNSYLMVSQTNHLWAGNEFPGHGVAFAVGRIVYDFYTDGTGASQVLSCGGNRVHDQDFNNTDTAYITEAPGCQAENLTFTYVQVGNELNIQFDVFPFPIEYIVSNDGSLFVSANVYNFPAVPCEDSDCTLSTAGARVNWAMKIGMSE